MHAAGIDDMVERLKARIGFTTEPTTHLVEKTAIATFAKAIGEMRALYHDESYARTTRFGTIIAPPTYVSCFLPDHFPHPVFNMNIAADTTLHSHDIVNSLRPIRAGETMTARAVYTDVYRRDGRKPMLIQIGDLHVDDEAGYRVSVVRVASVCL